MILWHIDPRRGRVVAAACPIAIQAGVRLGTPIAQAADLAAMTDAVLEPHDRDADRETLQSLASELQMQISPQAAIETLERFKWSGRFRHDPEAIFLEIQGVTHLFEHRSDSPPSCADPASSSPRAGELRLFSAVAKILQRHHLRARLAIADTQGAAWALANHAPPRANRSASRSTETPRPDDTHEFFIAPVGRTVEALYTLPCAALRLKPDVVATLARLGVETIGSLLQLPRQGLATRLGPALCQRIAQASGEVEESLIAIPPQCEHTASLLLEYPSDAMDLLADRLSGLIRQSSAALHRLQRGVLRLRCQLEFTTHPPMVLESGLFAPTLDTEHLTSLMLGALESQRLGSKVTRMTVAVAQHAALSSRQPSIFGPDFRSGGGGDWAVQTETARLIDVLAGRLGEDAVRGVRASDDPLPENAIVEFEMTAQRMNSENQKAKRKQRKSNARQQAVEQSDLMLHPSDSSHRGTRDSGPDVNDLGRRPIELHTPAHPITPIDSSSTPSGPEDHFPTRFRIRGRVERVCQHWGPERIETRWWRGPLIRRDYFRIELDNGGRLWIYYDLGDGTAKTADKETRWFLHGRFA